MTIPPNSLSSGTWTDAFKTASVLPDSNPDRRLSGFEKTAERLEAIARGRLLGSMKVAAEPRGVEVEDVMPVSKAHPGHMTNVEADVIEEMLRQRARADAQKADDDTKTAMAYLLSLPEGPDIVKKAIEQGEFLADKIAQENPELAASIAKTAVSFTALKPFLGQAGRTAVDVETQVGPHIMKQFLGRSAVAAPAGYVAGNLLGSTPEQKALYSKIGVGVGLGGAGLGAAATSRSMGKELEMLKLLERGTGTPGSVAALSGTSMAREEAIRNAAKELLKEAPPKTAEAIDPKAPGSLSAFLEKSAGGEVGFLRGILGSGKTVMPWGRMAAGAAAGGFAGSLFTDPDSENEGRNVGLGALGGAGLALGLSKPALTGKGLKLQASQRANRIALKAENARLLARNKTVNETQFAREQDIGGLRHEVDKARLLREKEDLLNPRRNQAPKKNNYDFSPNPEPPVYP